VLAPELAMDCAGVACKIADSSRHRSQARERKPNFQRGGQSGDSGHGSPFIDYAERFLADFLPRCRCFWPDCDQISVILPGGVWISRLPLRKVSSESLGPFRFT
jgi:hypothetical protein